ncbi:MAG: T9SS type A sorting domain-containing protein [Bacteroidota bacterium]|nr:T9SS type A sorting domain-containing protein [Bacteroidota bacterium]
MKREFYLIFLVISMAVTLNAQNTIPNGDFENWIVLTYDQPTTYPVSSNTESMQKMKVPNVVKTSDAYHGSYAVKVSTFLSASGDTVGGWFANASQTGNGDPTVWKGGMAYDQKPTGIRGYYKYNVATKDSALVGVVFKKGGKSFAHYFYPVGGVHDTYTPFSFTFNPPLTQAPDTMILVATASNLLKNNGIPGSVAQFDSISLTGVATQPLALNGDFEWWINMSTKPLLDNWNTDRDQVGVQRTMDAYTGNYALELTSSLGQDQYGAPAVQVGFVQCGEWNDGIKTFRHGFPVSIKQDAIVFYYKYLPSIITDSATFFINLKKGNMIVGGNGILLEASANYKRIELPLYMPGDIVADSAYIMITSSNLNNRSLSYVGSDLKIDGIAFLSQLLGDSGTKIAPEVTISPNPVISSAKLSVSEPADVTGWMLTLCSMDGKVQKIIPVTSAITSFDRDGLSSGLYLWSVTKDKTVIQRGKIIVQ